MVKYDQFKVAANLILRIGCVSSGLGLLTVGFAQQGNQARKPQTGTNQPFRYGDVAISNYKELSGTFSESVTATGPNTTVDAVDPKSPNVKSQIKASKIVATLGTKESKSEVNRVDAEGNLHFSSTRPLPDGTIQVFQGTGLKAIYYKAENRIVVLGPITYHAVSKSKDGVVLQTVTGTAGRANYDEDKKILRLEQGVNAKIESPTLRKPAELNDVTDLTLELGSDPVKFHIDGGSLIAFPKETGKK